MSETYGVFTIDRKDARSLLKSTRGKIASCLFIKKNGEERKMIFRTGVKKGVKGVGMSYNPAEYNLLTVFDMQKGEFRHINLNTLKEFKINGILYKVKEE